jgi:hypothetical protein
MPRICNKSAPKNQIDHTGAHSFVADQQLTTKTVQALSQTAVGLPHIKLNAAGIMFDQTRLEEWLASRRSPYPPSPMGTRRDVSGSINQV